MVKTSTLFLVKTKPKLPAKRQFTAAFSERLAKARTDTIYSRADVAEKCGVTKDTVRQWEDGRAVMPAAYWVTVCEMLYIDPWQLLTGRARHKVPDMPAEIRSKDKDAQDTG